MSNTLDLGGTIVEVVYKDIKHVHLSVYPPTGTVRITAPRRTNIQTLRAFAISKLGWIRDQQKKLREQDRQPPREYLDRESHYLWGRRYLLSVQEADAAPRVSRKHSRILLQVRPGADVETRDAVMNQWYREQIRAVAPGLIAKWEPVMGVKVSRYYVQRMKTQWGSCNPNAATIRLNSELAKKPRECLEYIIVHEMVHLLERNHTERFRALMDRFLPHWQHARKRLNAEPLGHEEWAY
ncbi:zinc metalloprotease [Thioalkalivibrio sulfidiphilus HL-EbGr7]|uniref:Zinc metalloprotease n=1 Tax=Thioalkalivibrio sulfidiphilus (strain HL-EbGR7) TaxID=396588 RepID=B8GSF2_THISH|nr:SprT family zinc-dependent metalloprotease [Thioalkalivibrio sulfidiphilus]ACL72856.1 zinc metalloprotease [Thioalkalivibrio sulfidiphilus HL-EbGr7]